jgi:uncharacterized RDD family membrane protein YckC
LPVSSQAAGWYDDPEDPAQQRYWDGNTWTDQRRPQQGPRNEDSLPRYGQPAQHGQVYGGGQTSTPQYGQDSEPRYGQRLPQYGQPGQGQYGQPGQGQYGQPEYGQPQYGQYAGPQQPQYGQYGGPQQSQYQHPPAGYGYPGQRVKVAPDGQPLSGWWRRVFAKIIDSIIVGIVGLPLTGYFYYQYMQVIVDYFEDTLHAAEAGTPTTNMTLPPEVYKWLIPAALIGFAVSFLYEYLFLTKKGSTPGKMALGIAVRYIPAGSAVPGQFVVVPPPGTAVAKRYGLQILFSVAGVIPLVGSLAGFGALLDYLWPLWDDRKQALHDKVAGTYVVRT